MDRIDNFRDRTAPLEMDSDEFRRAGYLVVDQIAEFLQTLSERPVTRGAKRETVRTALNASSIDALPEQGQDAYTLLKETIDLLFEHSLLNGHPGFMGWITSSAAPIGALGDFLASIINPNVGAWMLSPIATEIEAQTIRWIAEMIGYPVDCGGLLVSGGNMANFLALLTARWAKASWDIRTRGLAGGPGHKLRLYASYETHTWIHKAVDLSGLGLDTVRWVPTDDQLRLDASALRALIQEDRQSGLLPFLVVGNAGSTSTGAVDPLLEMAAICRENDLWFHIDAAYGGFASMLLDNDDLSVEVPADLRAMSLADSVAIDPHKWLYAPLEAGCVLVKDRSLLQETFSPDRPAYYNAMIEDQGVDYYQYGLQNSRGFRALKVWLALRQVGREGYVTMINQNILLAKKIYYLARENHEIQVLTYNLSITTFRYVPPDLEKGSAEVEVYLNDLNKQLLKRVAHSGRVLVSNAVIKNTFLLRACIVNFRTSLDDIEALITIVVQLGKEVDSELRPISLCSP